MSRIAVDLTPMLAGGKNGGAKIFALELLKALRTNAPEDEFLLLTSSWNHQELAGLDSPNMHRLCVLSGQEPQPQSAIKPFDQFLIRIYRFLQARAAPGFSWERLLASHSATLLFGLYRALRGRVQSGFFQRQFLVSRGVDLLFCPFTAPTYAEPGIPVVSIIYDLQHLDCPYFFPLHEIHVRDIFFNNVCRKADAIICISENTRKAVIRHLRINPKKTFTVHICIQARLVKLDPSKLKERLMILGINQCPYMFYPANFWPHKNHRMLLTAYGMFLSRNPGERLDLVFTGALEDLEKELKAAVKQMELEKHVHFLGFLSQDQVAAVWQGCNFLIFPSLYEGFGIPVLEAMSFGKPVICSNSTSLPEVAGDAALYFDPRKPDDIVQCLERIIKDPILSNNLVSRGSKRVATFRTEDMARKYLEICHSAIKNPQRNNHALCPV